MRQIKFRAWVKQEKKIFPVSDLNFDGNDDEPVGVNGCGDSSCPTCVEWYPFEFIELMQYTGLKDKNGVEIYEGDILYYTPFETHSNDRVVEYKLGFYHGKLIRNGYSQLLHECIEDVEVIGNIYSNPGLLEEEDE